MAFLSVIIPTYNTEKMIDRCLRSLASQTFQDFEVCIIDGKSSDKTIAVANTYKSDFKDLKIISESDKGTYDAMNKGIKITQGDWLYFLGSDDEIFDNSVMSDMSEIFQMNSRKKCSILYGNVYVNGDAGWAKDGQIYDGEFDLRKLLTKNICHQAIFYKKELFEKFGGYKIQYTVCADWEFNLRVFPRIKSTYIDRNIAKFHGGGISSGGSENPIGKDLFILRKKAIFYYKMNQFVSILSPR